MSGQLRDEEIATTTDRDEAMPSGRIFVEQGEVRRTPTDSFEYA